MINTLQLARHAGYVIAFACVDPDDLMIATIQAAGGVDDFLKELFAEMISESCIGSVQIFCFFGSPNFCPFAVDHHLTTTVQRHYKMPEKPVVTTNNGLFPVLGATVQSQQNSRFNVGLYRLVVVLRQERLQLHQFAVHSVFSILSRKSFFEIYYEQGWCPERVRDRESACAVAVNKPSDYSK